MPIVLTDKEQAEYNYLKELIGDAMPSPEDWVIAYRNAADMATEIGIVVESTEDAIEPEDIPDITLPDEPDTEPVSMPKL